jgi:Fur family transcriptional regulator, ferric uptake regulator
MPETQKPTTLAASGPTFDDVIDRFRSFLAGKGLRFTRERAELLSAIFQAPRHFEADDLIRTVDEREGHVSRATIYRTLGLLEECGILRKSLFGHNRHFYESTVGRHHHDHIVCIRCGQIREFEEDRIEDLQEDICRRFGYLIVDHVHEIFGICADCQLREENRTEPRPT